MLTYPTFKKYIVQNLEESTLFEDIMNLKKTLQTKEEVYIFGAGLAGQIAYESLKNNVDILAFIDNDEMKQRKTLKDLPIISLEEASHDKLILIASIFYKEISEQLIQEKYEFITYPVVYFEWDGCKTVEMLKSEEVLKKIYKFYIELKDDKSKNTLLNVLLYRISPFKKSLKSNEIEEQYLFERYSKPIKNIIDVGAYDGDTIKLFDSFFKKEIQYYAFEPTTYQQEKLKELQKKIPVNLFPYAVSNFNGTSYFEELDGRGGSNKLVEENLLKSNVVKTVTLDSRMSEFDKIDLIKMDIEGSELSALQGAKELITQDCPNLAICIYHKPSHLYEIFEYIYSLNIGYDFYLRHYGDTILETVLYAIPKGERHEKT